MGSGRLTPQTRAAQRLGSVIISGAREYVSVLISLKI